MFHSTFIRIYLCLYYLYKSIFRSVLKYFGPFYLIYYFDGLIKKNITLKILLGVGLHKYKYGIFYMKIFEMNDTHHLAYKGLIDHVYSQIKNIPRSNDQVVRKNIIFLRRVELFDKSLPDEPINFDLNTLDKYNRLIKNILPSQSFEPITQLDILSKLFDLHATHVKIIKKNPFRIDVVPLTSASVHMLYE